MTVTISPADEACQALVDQINGGGEYPLAIGAEYGRLQVDKLEEIDRLHVDVIHEQGTQLAETLAIEDRTSHQIAVYIRDKLPDLSAEAVALRSLIARQVFQRVNNFDSADGRVKVWQLDPDSDIEPDAEILRQYRLFVVKLVFRVEVEASYP